MVVHIHQPLRVGSHASLFVHINNSMEALNHSQTTVNTATLLYFGSRGGGGGSNNSVSDFKNSNGPLSNLRNVHVSYHYDFSV